MPRQITLAYAALAGLFTLLVLGGIALSWMQMQAYADAKARIAAVRIEADIVEAYAQAGLTSCDGRPCVKLDTRSPRWGRKGEYLLIDRGRIK